MRACSSDQFHREHAAGAQLGNHLREMHRRISGEIGGELLKIPFLAAEIQFAQE